MSRDFDQSDARELAGFAGLEIDGIFGDGGIVVNSPTKDFEHLVVFEPWSLEAPMWQTQSLLDAVREKGLQHKLVNKLVDRPEKSGQVGVWLGLKAPPEAICSAILSMEVD